MKNAFPCSLAYIRLQRYLEVDWMGGQDELEVRMLEWAGLSLRNRFVGGEEGGAFGGLRRPVLPPQAFLLRHFLRKAPSSRSKPPEEQERGGF